MNAPLYSYLILLLQLVYAGHGATASASPVQCDNLTITPTATGINLTSSTDTIQPALIRDFSVMCAFPKPADLVLATSIVISKGECNRTYQEIASVNFFRPREVIEQTSIGARITGELDPQGLTFIRLEWRFPSEDIAGVYLCEVNSLNSRGHPVSNTTSIRVVSKTPDEQSLVKLYRTFTKQQKITITDLEDELREQNTTDEELMNQIQTQKDQLRKQNDSISHMRVKLREQHDTDQELLDITQIQDDLLRQQSVTDRELLNQLRNQNITITNMEDQLQKQNVIADITSLTDRVDKMEKFSRPDLFDISPLIAGKQFLVSRIGSLNISRAEEVCQTVGGHLADIKSAAELLVIKTFMQTLASTAKFTMTYFSPTQANHTGLWMYAHSGENMTFPEVWDKGSPNTFFMSNCAALYLSTWRARNYHCDGYLNCNFICESSTAPQ